MQLHMPRSITLVRHGPSAHRGSGWYDRDALARWREAYDAAGILPGAVPPPALVRMAREAPFVVASDMRRARESVARLVDHDVPLSPLLREPLLVAPVPAGLRLPLAAWALYLGARWLVEGIRRTPPAPSVRAQAEAAADWLIEHATAHGAVLAVTHAGIRRQLGFVLVRRGWAAPGRRSMSPWSAWTFTHG